MHYCSEIKYVCNVTKKCISLLRFRVFILLSNPKIMPLVLHNFFNYLHNEEIRKRKKREKENIMRDINVREKALSRM